MTAIDADDERGAVAEHDPEHQADAGEHVDPQELADEEVVEVRR